MPSIISSSVWVKLKVKVTLAQALRLCTGRTAHRGSRGIALLFHENGTKRGKGSASRPGRSLPPGKTRYPFYRRLGGPQGRSGEVRKISPPPGFDPQTVQPVAIPTTLSGPQIYIYIVKCTLVQALTLCTGHTPHRGRRDIALRFHDERH